MPSFKIIGLLVLEKVFLKVFADFFKGFCRFFLKVFAIYSCGSHLDHVTIYINVYSPFLRMLHITFGFDLPNGFRKEYL